MIKVKSSLINIRKKSSSNRVVLVLVAITIIGVIVETGIIRVSGFVDIIDSSVTVKIFVGVGIFCIVSQLIILNFVSDKIGNSFRPLKSFSMKIINKGAVIVQLGIIIFLVLVLLEVALTATYNKNFVIAVIILSFLTAACMMAFLAWRFIIWFRSNKNGLILAYLIASLAISISAVAGMIYLLDQLFYQPGVVHPKIYGEFITHVLKGNSSLVYAYTISSAIAFILLWIGTVLLLRSYRKKLARPY